MTAAAVNPATVTGVIDATGCDIGVYYDHGRGSVKGPEVRNALYYGIFVNGDVSAVTVDISGSYIHDIGDTPFNGNQRGVAIYYRGYMGNAVTGKISGNTVKQYQKGGIVANGVGTKVDISANTITGLGPVGYIAQNGIQIGYGASAQVQHNIVTGHSYQGTSTVSGGIIVVGGPGYGMCPLGIRVPTRPVPKLSVIPL